MLVVKIFLATLLLVLSFASEETNYSRHLSRVLRLSRRSSSSDARKRQDETNYFEQCSFVNTWKEQLGHVSVLAFLDPAWQYSFRQAVMLKQLSSRLRKSGFSDIRFFVITPPSDLTEDKIEDDDFEIEVWRKIATMYETEDLVNVSDHFFKDSESEIIFFQDGPQFHMWKKFRASKDQVVVIDRCGKLTYQVIVPWSILYFPYVKAAILSTYQEDPCGGCNPIVYQFLNWKKYVSSLENTTAKETDSRENDNVEADLIWTTEQWFSENDSAHFEKSLKENMTESSVVSETSYQYDNDTSFPNENNSKETQRQGNSENDTTSGETEELQQDLPSRPNESTSMSDNSINKDAKNRVLSSNESTADEIKNKFISMRSETTSSDIAGDDKIRNNNEDATDNLRTVEEIDSVDKNTEEKENTLSLRVIMRAPHVHRNENKMRKYTHLLLKIDNPNFHGHLDNFKDVDLQVADSEKNDSEADRENIDRTFIFDKDESPGLYGEIADYWRDREDDEDSDDINKNESFSNDTYNNSTISYNEKHHINISGHATLSKTSEIDENYSMTNITINAYINNSTNPQNTVKLDKTKTSSESINTSNEISKKEEMRNNLMKHYNKLLSWIDYRLIR